MSGDHQIGPFVLSARTQELSGRGVSVRLNDRAFNLLRVLSERPDQVVPKKELLERCWPDAFVVDGSLRFQINNLRKVLGSLPDSAVSVLNVAGRGYLLAVGEPGSWEADDAAAPPNTTLPQRPAPLVGRDKELELLANWLRSSRLLSFVGPGGVGKTSVAISLAASVRNDFEHVWFVDFSSVDDPSKALLSTLTALHITSGGDDPVAAIVAFLRPRSALLILDNCEHVLEPVARLATALIGETTNLRIVATSREPLRIEQEVVRRIPPLMFPDQALEGTVEQLLDYSAVKLFADRALARSGYRLVESDCAAVAQICRDLDGVPLAIELAAGWTEAFAPSSIAADLGSYVLRTGRGSRNAAPRHRTLEAAIRWSYDRLSAVRQAQLARLAVFRSQFDLDSALAVLGPDRDEALTGLDELVAMSLVDVRQMDGEAAYRLLFLPRACAEEQLQDAAFEQEARHAHARVVLAWLNDYEPEWASWTLSHGWLTRYGPIVDDVRAALQWALSPNGDLDLACNLALDAAQIWFRLSIASEGLASLAEAIERLEQRPHRNEALELKLKTVRAVLLMYTRTEPGSLLSTWREIIEATYAEPDRTTRQLIAWVQWQLSCGRGQYRAGAVCAQRFQELAAPDELADQVAATRMLSLCQMGLGEFAHARRGLEEVIAVRDRRLTYSAATRFQFDQTSSSLTYLARILWVQGDSAGAFDAAKRAVAIAESAHHGLSIEWALLYGMAQTSVLIGDFDAAQAAIERYRASPSPTASRDVHAVACLALRGMVAASRGQMGEAVELICNSFSGQWMRICIHYMPVIGLMCEILGRAGQTSLALSHLDAVLIQTEGEPGDGNLPELRRAKAALLMMAGGTDAREEALALLDIGLTQAVKQGAKAWEARIKADRDRLIANGYRH
jgi:predicted ATPase/DNA-binding winged helix-turn-helix (wHTH) protein